jgi:plasmid maintenance system killer protein
MKESFYFPHDYEAANDPKVQALLSEYGGIGYGVFWRIIELLHSDEEHKIPMKQYIFIAIAKQMLASAEQIMAIVNFAINECELFETDGDFIWSKRVNRNFLRRKEISEKRSISGKLGAEKKWAMANAKQNLAKHGKEKEIKEKKNTYSADFLSFWNAYPKHKKRDDAYKAWKGLNGTRPSMDVLLKAIEEQKISDDWKKDNGQFIPYPATWLRSGSWADEGLKVVKSSSW